MKSLKLMIVCCLAFSVLFYAGIQKATAGETFTVAPSGLLDDTDTVNIRNALNMAVDAGPGNTVKLGAGMFTLTGAIQATDFDGTLTGTGEPQFRVQYDKNGRITRVTQRSGTVIQTSGDPFPPAGPPMPVGNAVFCFHMEERGGSLEDAPDIKIKDIAVVHAAPTTAMRILDPYGNEIGVGKQIIVFWIGGRYTLAEPGPSERPFPLIDDGYGWHAGDTCYCNVEFNRVKVTGQMESGDYPTLPFLYQAWLTDYKMDPNPPYAISFDCFWQRMIGKMEVRNCEMNGHGAPSGICAWEVEDSQITVTDCVAENSPMSTVVSGGNVEGPTNCKIEVSYVNAQGPAAVFLGPSDCDIQVKNCEAENSLYGGAAVGVSVPSNCKIQVRDCKVKSNLDSPAVYLEWLSNCEVNVSNLNTEGCSGVTFMGSDGTSTYQFMDNNIHCPVGHWWAGFEMYGAPGDRVSITNSTIDSPRHTAPFGGIYSENIDHGVVERTTITGEGLAAIYLGIPPNPWYYGGDGTNQVEGWHLVGNNVEDFIALEHNDEYPVFDWVGVPFGESRAPIWLGEGTSGCTVVGGPGYGAYVYDEGTGNIIEETR